MIQVTLLATAQADDLIPGPSPPNPSPVTVECLSPLRPKDWHPRKHGARRDIDRAFSEQLPDRRGRQGRAGIPAHSGETHLGQPAVARERRRGGSRTITLARTAALAPETPVGIAVAFRRWLLTRQANAHAGQVYRAPGNFTNSPPGTPHEQPRRSVRRPVLST